MMKYDQLQLLAELFETWKERGGEPYYLLVEETLIGMASKGIIDEMIPAIAKQYRENGYTKRPKLTPSNVPS
jgi:hypothetical protein